MAEGKQRFTEYKTDKADGSVNWAQEGKDAMKDWKPQVHISRVSAHKTDRYFCCGSTA